MMALY